LPTKCVYLGGRQSYGSGEKLYLTEEQARELLGARRIKLVKPDRLPAYLEPEKPGLPYIGPTGAAQIILGPVIAGARLGAQP
jgi:hypothetical protein